jgi:hypothetical protein
MAGSHDPAVWKGMRQVAVEDSRSGASLPETTRARIRSCFFDNLGCRHTLFFEQRMVSFSNKSASRFGAYLQSFRNTGAPGMSVSMQGMALRYS